MIQEWRRVSRPSATVIFTAPAAGGLTVNRLLHAAASSHGVSLPDPHAALGSEAAIRTFARPLGLSIDRVNQLRFPEPLDSQPQAAFNAVINYYGYTGVLHGLPDPTRERIFEDYQRAHLNAAPNGEGAQDWLFIRGHL